MGDLLLSPYAVIVTGVEDDRETGGVRVYVGPRYRNRYSLIVDPVDCAQAMRAWRSHGHVIGDYQDLWPLHDEGANEA